MKKKQWRRVERLGGFMDAFMRGVLRSGTEGDHQHPMIAREPIRVGVWMILVVFIGFGSWAALAPLNSAAIAQGVVVVDSNRKTIQHLEGGIIEEIMVHEGMQVQAGQPLVRLSETAAKARLDLLQNQYVAAKATQLRLRAERDQQAQFALEPAEFTEVKVDDAEKHEIIETQQRLFEARRLAVNGQIDVLRQRIAQLKEEINGLEAQEESTRSQSRLIAEEVATVKTLVEQKNAKKSRLLELQRTAAALEGKRGEYLAMIARARQTITESELEIINVHNNFLNDVAKQLQEVQVQLGDLKERIRASSDIFDRLVIVAPQSGVVTGLKFHTKGGVVAPGDNLMDIVPQDDKQIIEAKISTQDIDVVRPGLPARVRLTAYKVRNVPPVEGTVKVVSADKFTNERTGESYYLGRIEVDQASLDSMPDVQLYPGMPAEVLIVTGERTLLSYLMSPITNSVNRSFREQ